MEYPIALKRLMWNNKSTRLFIFNELIFYVSLLHSEEDYLNGYKIVN